METTEAHPGTAEFLLLSPLPNWRGTGQSVSEGIRIRRLAEAEATAIQASETVLHHHEIDGAARAGYWLCYEFENPYPADNVRYRRRQEAAFKLMLHAMYAIQILAPIGTPNLSLLYRVNGGVPVLDSTQHRPALIGTVWACDCTAPASFEEEIPVVLERVREAFQKPILRLQIPVWLLEQGLTAADRHIRILLWATGLDALTRSGGTVAFAERLCGLLGSDSWVFPANRENRQPVYKVGDVAEDLYLLRNEMAHGLPFHEKFRKRRGFLADDGQPVTGETADHRYDHVLEECAGFLLSKALREILLRQRSFDPRTKEWLAAE